jgi:phage terminase small subunit
LKNSKGLTTTPPRPPGHLSQESKRFWTELLVGWPDIADPAGRLILQAALENRDTEQAARKQITRDGLTVVDKAGQLKSHPLLVVARDARAAFLAGLKQLNLDVEPLRPGPGRPPGR